MNTALSPTSTSLKNLLKAIGPGVLVACAAIGGSHLVWATRAGAQYGWALLGLILLANFLKFPFFLYGQRYTAATGESLLHGYKRQGIVYIYVFLAINALTATSNIAAVAMLSGALFAGYGLGTLSITQLTMIILAICAAITFVGRYKLIDRTAKWIISLLSILTLAAVILALSKERVISPDFQAPSPWSWAALPFLISLMGWMPAPIDLSAWSSLWMFSREKQTKHFASVKETSIDFYLSYAMIVIMGVAFMALGNLVMFGTGETFSATGTGFSIQLVNLYAQTIGEWSRDIILSAAFLTMFSTTLTCVDGYPRALAASFQLIRDHNLENFQRYHRIWIALIVSSSTFVLLFLIKNLMAMLTFGAVVSFVTSPILAYINLKVMSGSNVPESHRPSGWLKLISWIGLTFFILMSLGYVYVKFIRA